MYVVYIFDRRLEINGPMTVVTELPSKLSYIHHVEEDKLSPGSVLFATPFALTRTDNSRLDVIAGSLEGIDQQFSPFRMIHSFYQLNPSFVVVVDYSSCCLGQVDRPAGTTSAYMGVCSSDRTSCATVDGSENQARFNGPFSIIGDIRNTSVIFVSEIKGHRIR